MHEGAGHLGDMIIMMWEVLPGRMEQGVRGRFINDGGRSTSDTESMPVRSRAEERLMLNPESRN